MYLRSRHVGVHIPWPLAIIVGPFYVLGLLMVPLVWIMVWLMIITVRLLIWSVTATIHLIAWCVRAGRAAHHAQPRPPRPVTGSPAAAWRGYSRPLLDESAGDTPPRDVIHDRVRQAARAFGRKLTEDVPR